VFFSKPSDNCFNQFLKLRSDSDFRVEREFFMYKRNANWNREELERGKIINTEGITLQLNGIQLQMSHTYISTSIYIPLLAFWRQTVKNITIKDDESIERKNTAKMMFFIKLKRGPFSLNIRFLLINITRSVVTLLSILCKYNGFMKTSCTKEFI